MNYNKVIDELERNKNLFKSLLSNIEVKEQLWKPKVENWCLLEVVCHLLDEEKEDFRARVKHTLESPDLPMLSINPSAWVEERRYIQQNFSNTLDYFLQEREQSIAWLRSLENPNWDNFYVHEKFGEMTAKMFLSNWLAHDYLHIKQILKIKFNYLKSISDEPLSYAGDW